MKLYLTTELDAQIACASGHQHKINTDIGYAKSVIDGKTTCWCIPVIEADGWAIHVKDRGMAEAMGTTVLTKFDILVEE